MCCLHTSKFMKEKPQSRMKDGSGPNGEELLRLKWRSITRNREGCGSWSEGALLTVKQSTPGASHHWARNERVSGHLLLRWSGGTVWGLKTPLYVVLGNMKRILISFFLLRLHSYHLYACFLASCENWVAAQMHGGDSGLHAPLTSTKVLALPPRGSGKFRFPASGVTLTRTEAMLMACDFF